MNDEEEQEEAGQQDQDEQHDQLQQRQQQSGRAGRSQQQAQARQNTLVRKAKKGQEHLTFVAHDKAVLEQLPAFVQQQLPFLPTARGAIDVQLLTMLKLFATAGVGFATMVKVLKELQHTQYYQRMLVYCSCAAAVKEVCKPSGEVVCHGIGKLDNLALLFEHLSCSPQL